jgi:uncharacterized protein
VGDTEPVRGVEAADEAGAATVTVLSVTPVKGTRLRAVDEIALGPTGARGDRRFFLIDENSRMLNGKVIGELQEIIAGFDSDAERLTLEFPDGKVVSDTIVGGPSVTARFFSREREDQLVVGPWSAAISEHIGRPLRLVMTDSAVDRGAKGAASLVSSGSLWRLAQERGAAAIDARRFRMLIEVDGLDPHAEDAWVGRQVRVGAALIRFEGHIGRCLITSRDPDTGSVDLPTLELLRAYRGELDSTEPLPFGIHGSVLEPGVVRIGDPVELVGA